jgi:hypothetical protein
MSSSVLAGAQGRRGAGLALQLRFPLDVRFSCGGLVRSSPERPRDDMGWSDLLLRKPHGDTADLLN